MESSKLEIAGEERRGEERKEKAYYREKTTERWSPLSIWIRNAKIGV
jgi:hypothetical protein